MSLRGLIADGAEAILLAPPPPASPSANMIITSTTTSGVAGCAANDAITAARLGNHRTAKGEQCLVAALGFAAAVRSDCFPGSLSGNDWNPGHKSAISSRVLSMSSNRCK
jgi:hypothetical protein